jgi:hypothetical protein
LGTIFQVRVSHLNARKRGCIKSQRPPTTAGRPTALETANEMYKFAFLTKKHKFAKKFPDLSDKELHQKTVAYFVALPKD